MHNAEQQREDRVMVLSFLWSSSFPVVSLPAQTFQRHPPRARTERHRGGLGMHLAEVANQISLFIYSLPSPPTSPPLFSQQEPIVVSLLSPLLFPLRQKLSTPISLTAAQHKTQRMEAPREGGRLACCGQIMNILTCGKKTATQLLEERFILPRFLV